MLSYLIAAMIMEKLLGGGDDGDYLLLVQISVQASLFL